MPVIATNEWLTTMRNSPRSFISKLARYFPDLSAKEFIPLLMSHGMFQIEKESKENIEAFIKKNWWAKIRPHFSKLQALWNGPDIPVLLFPSNSKNRRLQREFNGKSGVAFSDKLFLFMNEQVEKEELLAVLTHEYHHICRLRALKENEDELTLLDTIIMEGMAEHAVCEQLGDRYLAPWTKYYELEQAMYHWERYIYPKRNVKKQERQHDELLYGMRWFPNMVGYNTGYHLVKQYTELNHLSSKQLMHMSTQEIVEKSGFKG